MRCGYCGAPLRGASAHNRRCYRDASQIEHTLDCPQPLVCADDIEQQAVEHLRSILTDDAVTQAIAAQTRLAQSEARFKRAQELYVLGEISRELYDAKKARRENLTASLTTTKCYHSTT